MVGLMQLFAYYGGLTLGRDIDRPRNIAKTVAHDSLGYVCFFPINGNGKY
jgi:hypothetical protein